MTTAQWIYVALLATYFTLFLVFTRMFYWKYFADKRYYKKRPTGLTVVSIAELAHQEGKVVPQFSIFVPARNEGDVIEKTIDHLSHLRYSPDHYEILVVTDEKECQAATEERSRIMNALTAFLVGEMPWPGGDRLETVLISLLSRLSLEEAQLAEQKAGQQLSIREILTLRPQQRQEILQDIALSLLSGKGHINRNKLCEVIRRCLPQATQTDIARLYPIFLSFAIPTVMTAAQLRNEQPERLISKLMTEAAAARQPLTQKVLTALSETVSSRIVKRLQTAATDTIQTWLQTACTDALPTTQEIVERKRLEFAAKRNVPALKHVVVPWDFDGSVDGGCTGAFVPSTKGRALNYAFRFSNGQSSMWAFWDAESRPHSDVLLYIAWCRLTVGDDYQIAQGPVYQVRNFWKMGPVCKIVGLFQALSHEWNMPWLLRSLPFMGGTNMFIGRNLMLKIGAFDHTVLTEDMELGARAWLKGGAWPHFVPYPSSEQTPPTLKGFYRQRLRWGSGYLQVFDKIKGDDTLPWDKKNKLLRTYWWKGHFSWTLFQLAPVLPILVLILKLNHLIDPTAVPWFVSSIFIVMAPTYLIFTFYCFFHYYEHMDEASPSTRVTGFAQLLTLPISALMLPIPYSSALVLKWMGRQPKGWVKTPRTKE